MLKLMQTEMTLGEKLEILSDAAKYDVSCTSGGTERKGDGEGMGNCRKAGICHSFSADGRCISLLNKTRIRSRNRFHMNISLKIVFMAQLV